MKAAISLLLLAAPIFACDCRLRQTICAEVHTPGVIFIGTVETMAPRFMSRWNPMPRPSMQQLNQANERYLADRTPANFAALKDSFRKLFPSLPDPERRILDNAADHAAIVALFSSVLAHGQLIHLRAREVFRNDSDDDDDQVKSKTDKGTAKPKDARPAAAKDDDEDVKTPAAFDIWTPFGDCGVD